MRSVKIEIDESQIGMLRALYNAKIKELQLELKGLEKLLDQLNTGRVNNERINDINDVRKAEETAGVYSAYNAEWRWEQKIDYIIEDQARTSAQIADAIAFVQKLDKAARDKALSSISAVLSQKSKENGKYVKTKNDRGENLFSLRK